MTPDYIIHDTYALNRPTIWRGLERRAFTVTLAQQTRWIINEHALGEEQLAIIKSLKDDQEICNAYLRELEIQNPLTCKSAHFPKVTIAIVTPV